MYDANKVKPAFAFGHGLSYTTFEYSGLTFDTPTLTATFTIKNTGSLYGAEVAQLYLGFPANAGEPPKVLRGFRKVATATPAELRSRHLHAQVGLSAGENRIVSISMADKDLSIWNSQQSNWQRWHGQFSV
jgi:beta-glucosidase